MTDFSFRPVTMKLENKPEKRRVESVGELLPVVILDSETENPMPIAGDLFQPPICDSFASMPVEVDEFSVFPQLASPP